MLPYFSDAKCCGKDFVLHLYSTFATSSLCVIYILKSNMNDMTVNNRIRPLLTLQENVSFYKYLRQKDFGRFIMDVPWALLTCDCDLSRDLSQW